MPTLVRLREANLTGATDPAEYAATLQALLAGIGNTVGSAEADAVRILDQARQEVTEVLKALAVDSPSRGVYERARSGIDQAIANMADDLGKSVADYQAAGFFQGVDLAIKPLGGEKGLEVVASAVTQQQLAVLSGFSADLIQNLAADTRARVNAEIAAVVVGAKSPYSAARMIGANLKDRNHFSTIAHRARAIVVTEVGRSHALGTQAAQNQLQATFDQAGTGDKVRKRWLNAHLPGARQTHLEAEARYAPDGAKGPIPHDQLFEVGGFKALYPRDPSLPASESVHCHCVAVTIIDEGSAQAVAAGAPTAQAQASYTAAKAEAAAPAEKATAKGPQLTKAGATFLGDPYGQAGLKPLKPLPDGSNGYGGEFLATKLGYTKEANPLVWDPDLKAFKHPKAPAGKQLPTFDQLTALEQKALMDNAGLSTVAQNKVYKHLGVEKPKASAAYAVKKPDAPTGPVTPPTPPPPPTPTTPPPTPTPAAPAAAAARRRTRGDGPSFPKDTGEALPGVAPAWDPGKPPTKKPSVGRKPFLDRIKEVFEEYRARGTYYGGAPKADNLAMRTIAKDKVMRDIGDELSGRITAAQAQALIDDYPRRYHTAGSPRGPHDELASMLVQSWAATSGDASPGALAIQRAVADVFDLDWPPVGYTTPAARNALADADKLWAKHRGTFDHFVRAQYTVTQRELDLMYPGEGRTVRLVRGMHLSNRGTWDGPRVEPVALNPASSFAVNTTTSKRFGSTLIYVDVPKERILGTSLSGFGCLNEYEYVVIGSRLPEDMATVGANWSS